MIGAGFLVFFFFLMDMYEQRLDGLCKYKKIVAGVIRV